MKKKKLKETTLYYVARILPMEVALSAGYIELGSNLDRERPFKLIKQSKYKHESHFNTLSVWSICRT